MTTPQTPIGAAMNAYLKLTIVGAALAASPAIGGDIFVPRADIQGSGTNRTITIFNDTTDALYWLLCLQVSSRSFNDNTTGYTSAGSASQYGLYVLADDVITWRVFAKADSYPSPYEVGDC